MKTWRRGKGLMLWFPPVILATWEAEMRRIMIWGQPGQIVCETRPPHLQNNQSKMDWRYASSGFARWKPWVQAPVAPHIHTKWKQPLLIRQTNKQNMAYPYTGILLNLKEWNSGTCFYNKEEPEKLYWHKTSLKELIFFMYDSLWNMQK
jgi:hypothetical protein